MKLNFVIVVVALLLRPSLGAKNETQTFGENTMNMLIPPTAAPTDSPAPTAPTTSPTDSPVPSPSPSEIPTGEPTITPRPTGTPTQSPTDSPVPSPSPSAIPSTAPSTTPSHSPSSIPSSVPSEMPSSSPSLSTRPSSEPSISGAPSSEPSAQSIIMSTLVSVTMQGLLSGLSGDTLKVFQEQAADFIQNELPDAETMGVRVNITSVKVVEQKIVLGDNNKGNATRRFLQESGLRVRMEVKGEVSPGVPPDDFDFSSIVSIGFAKNYLVFLYRLGSADPFFNQLLGGAPNPYITDTGESSGKKGKGATAGIVIACMAAVAIAAAAAMYAFHLRDKKSAFKRPDSIATGNGDKFCLERSDSRSSCMTPYDQAHPNFKSLASPNTLENGGKSTRLGIARQELEANILSPTDTVQSERFCGLGIRVPAKRDTDQYQKGTYCGTIPFCGLFDIKDKKEKKSLYDISCHRMGDVDPNVPKEVDTSNLIVPRPITKTMSEPVMTGKKSLPSAMHKSEPAFKTTGKNNPVKGHEGFTSTTKSEPLPEWRNDEESLDEKLMKDDKVGFGKGENDPWRASRRSFTNIEYISDDESVLFEKATTEMAEVQTGGYACGAIPGLNDMSKMAGGLLGARRMDQDEQVQYKERKSEEALPQKRTGLYDVYAPPGALGIVVDTTMDGPVIHSLKASSSLLGLAGAGDLIVGLDDTDTRSMTAATLTRLMAKRAHLPERKLTLLAMDK